jgi:WhiB family redox-sensing transcriptional regulator
MDEQKLDGEQIGHSYLVYPKRTRYVVAIEGVMITYMEERSWREYAACRGPQARMFFPPSRPEKREEKARRELDAKSICAECRVQPECLSYAIRIREPHGIWGGLNEVERRRLLSREAG